MRKKTLLKLIFTASCLLATYSLLNKRETTTLNKLAFQNIEALASGENDDNAYCLDCRTVKVEYKVTNFSLD